jgi:hypothetical protein
LVVTMTMRLFNRLWKWTETNSQKNLNILLIPTYLLQLWNQTECDFLKWKKLQKKDTALFWVRCILYEFIYQRIIYFQTRTENVCTSPYTDLYLRDSWNYY